MARPPRLEYPRALYHVTARGNDRGAVFRDDRDRQEYLERIETHPYPSPRVLGLIYLVGLSKKISQSSARHCAALVHADEEIISRRGALAPLLAQGTITFVELDGGCLGVTNEHVVRTYLSGGASGRLFIALPGLHEIPANSLIALSTPENWDAPFDIAVVRLDRASVVTGGKEPAKLSERRLKEGSLGLAVGFPGRLRRPLNPSVMVHPLVHVVATCLSSSDRTLILQNRLEAGTPPILFGGMSGGAVFELDDDETAHLVGIVSEGRGFREAEESMLPEDDVWIHGFPLTESSLRHILQTASYNG